MAYIAYVGSFDPFHLGHLEAAIKSIECVENCKALVFIPNNPRHGKPGRSPLQFRAYLMSHLFPVYNNQNWMADLSMVPPYKMIVDTSSVNVILQKLRETGDKIVGICGSDVVSNKKEPKWKPDKWIILEREGDVLPISMDSFYGIPCRLVRHNETKRQYISSSKIRDGSLKLVNAIPKAILAYYSGHNQRKLGFSNHVVDTWIEEELEGEYFVKELCSEEFIDEIVEPMKEWCKNVPDDIVRSPKFIKSDGSKIYITLLKDHVTLWDMMINDHPKTNIYMIEFFKRLNNLHSSGLPISHGDINPSNVMCDMSSSTPSIALCDFDKIKPNNKEAPIDTNLREWYQFWASIKYFSNIYGVQIPENRVNLWKELGQTHYKYQFRFSEGQRRDAEQVWIQKEKREFKPIDLSQI